MLKVIQSAGNLHLLSAFALILEHFDTDAWIPAGLSFKQCVRLILYGEPASKSSAAAALEKGWDCRFQDTNELIYKWTATGGFQPDGTTKQTIYLSQSSLWIIKYIVFICQHKHRTHQWSILEKYTFGSKLPFQKNCAAVFFYNHTSALLQKGLKMI